MNAISDVVSTFLDGGITLHIYILVFSDLNNIVFRIYTEIKALK